MLDMNKLPLARLDLPPRGYVTGRPEHTDGLTVTVGRCGHPMSNSVLVQITHVFEHPAATAAETAAEQAAADLAGEVSAAVAAAVGRSDAFAVYQQANAAAAAAQTAFANASADLDDAQAAIATALAARPPRDTSAIRPAVAAAGAAKHRARERADMLSAEAHVARVALDAVRVRIRAGLVGEQAAVLAGKRSAIRVKVVDMLEEVQAGLLAVDAQTRALGIDQSAPLPPRTAPATAPDRASAVPVPVAVVSAHPAPGSRAAHRHPTGRVAGSVQGAAQNIEDVLLGGDAPVPEAGTALPIEDAEPVTADR